MKALADPELELGQIESAERSRRASVLRSLQASVTQGKCSKSAAVKDAAWELGVSTTTVWRLLRKFLDGEGRASSLAPGQRGRPKGLSQVTSTVEALIEEHLRLYYLKRERASFARVVAEIRVACKIEGLPPPARRTVQRRLDAMDAREVLRARSGAKAARHKFAAVTGANNAERPLEVVQIDHTSADVILVDSFERKAIGRPWVTLAIDIATRMITGYYVSLDAPSRLSIALCLTRAVAPKADLLADIGTKAPWPAQGKPHKIHVDNGSDFRSRAFQASCAEWGIDLTFRPPGSPHFGGHIERLIGTMMGAVHLLPGTTQATVSAKGTYDSEGKAAMTLAEFDVWFALEICRYNNSIHSSLGCTPVSKWDALAGEMASDIPFDMDAFRVSFLPSERRQIRRDGVHLFKIRYWSDALAGYIGRKDGATDVRYDPRDLSSVWVELEAGRCVQARYRNLEMPPMSLWEYREARQYRLAQGKEDFDETILAELIHLQRQIADGSQALTKTERRSRERREVLKTAGQAESQSEGLRAVDTGDTSRPLYKVERW